MMCGPMAKERSKSGHQQKHRQHSNWLVCRTRPRGISEKMEGPGMRNEKNSLDKVNALMITGNGKTDKQV